MRKTPKSKTLVSYPRIKSKVRELAGRISKDYRGKKLVLVGVLKGSFVFMADLIKEIKIPLELDFIQVASYGAGKTSSGVIKIKKDIDLSIVGKHVLIIEDIVDYGYTLNYLLKFIRNKKPKSVRICALLDKPSRREVRVPIAYKGFEVPDTFVVGYGLDFSEKFRNSKDIRSLLR